MFYHNTQYKNIPFENSFISKANISIKGENIHCGDIILDKYIAPFNADVINFLIQKEFYPTLIGHCDSFAIGGRGYNSWLGNGINPYDSQQIVGGSSYGCAIAIYEDKVPFGLGSSTGGSIRIPCHFTKLYGFEPSQGAISRSGLVLHSSSMDKIGLMTKDFKYIYQIFNILTQPGNDMQNRMFSFNTKSITRIGIYNDVNCQYKDTYISMIKKLSKLSNIEIIDISSDLNFLDNIYKMYYSISGMEAFFNLGRFNGSRFLNHTYNSNSEWFEQYNQLYDNMAQNTQDRLSLGQKLLQNPNTLDNTMQNIDAFREQIKSIFLKVDSIFLPTTPFEQFFNSNTNQNDIDAIDQFTSFTNMFGGCALSIPLSTKSSNYFHSVQFIANCGNDIGLIDFINQNLNIFKE